MRPASAFTRKAEETLKSAFTIGGQDHYHFYPYIEFSEYRASVVEDDLMMREYSHSGVRERPKESRSPGRKRESIGENIGTGFEGTSPGSQSREESKSSRDKEPERQGSERGLVVRHSTIVKVAEEFDFRREQVRNLSDALKEKESLVNKLRSEVARVRNELVTFKSAAQDEIRKQRAAALDQVDQKEKKIETKEEQIEYYEFKLRARDKELEELRQDLLDARRREIELGIQLEIHDFKFCSYSNYQRDVDSQALAKIGDKEGKEYEDDNEELYMQYMRKLVADLNEMEQIYVRSKIDAADKVSLLGEELQDAHAQIERLENRIAAYRKTEKSFDSGCDTTAAISVDSDVELNLNASGSSDGSGDDGGAGVIGPTIANLKKAIEYLEAQNAQYSQETRRLRLEAESLRASVQERDETSSKELDSLRLENEGLIHKISALQIESGLSSGKIDNSTKGKRYKMLEKNLDDYIVEMMRFEDQLRMKERIITRLSSQLLEKRVAFNLEHSSDREDLDNLRPAGKSSNLQGGDQRTKATMDETLASSVDLEKQLATIQEQMRQKDEFLTSVRANYSARVARLKLQLAKSFHYTPTQPSELYFI